MKSISFSDVRRRPGVDVDAAVHRKPRRVVHGRDGTPERNAAEVLVQVERQDLVGPDGDRVCRAALARRRAALRRGVGPMGAAPVARAAVAAFLDGDDVTRHVGAGHLEGRRQVRDRTAIAVS